MRRLPKSYVDREFGVGYPTTAIAAIQKYEDPFRIIQDGTHEVRANPQIIVRDPIAYLAAGEKTVTLLRSTRKRSTLIGLKADVSRAHRRVKALSQTDVGNSAGLSLTLLGRML
eukprot:5545820-Karenia_brevis.AAC.1